MAVRAQARYVRMSPRKVREVVDLIRGKSVADARTTLVFANRGASGIVAKVLNSAVANAENNNKLKPESLRIKEAVAGTATSLKRFTPKARGSAGPIIKRRCHVKITLSDE